MTELELAMQCSLSLLKFRNRTEKEIADRLRESNFSKITAKKTIKRLKELFLLDDRKFTVDFIKYSTENGKGLLLIQQELEQRGISAAMFLEVKDELHLDEKQEYETAEKLFEKRIKKNRDKTSNKVYYSAGNYLARRGFSSEIIEKLLSNYIKD